MVTSFGCCWYTGSAPQSLDCWSSCNVQGKMSAGGMSCGSGVVMEDVCEVCVWNLDERLVLMLMRAVILVGGQVVVAVRVMVVVLGMVSFEERYLSVMEVECWRLGFGLIGGDISKFGGGFLVVVVEMEVSDLELEVEDVVKMVWYCVNGKLFFFFFCGVWVESLWKGIGLKLVRVPLAW